MKLSDLLLLPLGLQGFAILIDEFYFHHQRGLPRWERWGHPLDTLTVLVCYFFLLAAQPSTETVMAYIGLCVFSSLFITKDEFVHLEQCSPGEAWLHSVLFILHPIVFAVVGIIWAFQESFLNQQLYLWQAFKIQVALTFIFLVYQTIYWNFFSKAKNVSAMRNSTNENK